jgi:hypothetical protein
LLTLTDSSHRVAPVEDSLEVLREIARRQDGGLSSVRRNKKPLTPWEEELIHTVAACRGLTLLGPEHELYKFGRFEGIAFRGRGGFGLVFEARDPELDRHVALKLRRKRGPADAEEIIDEARALAKVSHPNVISIYETGIHEGDPFFVMEYVHKCRTVYQFAAQKPRPTWEEIVDVYRGAAAGLAAVHAAGIVHNDFKPGNILLDQDNWPRVADFGLAHVMLQHAAEAEREELRRRGGTLPYTAPEVLLGFPGDELSDQWSFCASLWHTLDGAPPYGGRAITELLETIDQDEPEFMSDGVPKALQKVLRVGLSADPNERYPDMKTLLGELDKLRQPRLPRLRWIVVIGVVFLLVGLAGGRLLPTPGGGAFVDHVVGMTAGQQAVAAARAGDGDRALQLLENAQLRASEGQMHSLATASQQVANQLEAHEAWEDAMWACMLSIKFARIAGDDALEQLARKRAYEAAKRWQPTAPPHRSR